MAERIQWRDVADAVAPAHGCVLVVRRDAIQTCGLLMRLAHQLGREGVPVVAVAGTVESGDTWERDGNVTVVKLAGAFRLPRRQLSNRLRRRASRRRFDRVVQEVARHARPRSILFENADTAGLAMRLKRVVPGCALVYLASELSGSRTPSMHRRHERRVARHIAGIIMNEPHRLAIWYRDMGRRIPGTVIPNTVWVSEMPSGRRDRRILLDCFPRRGEGISTVLVYQGLLEQARCLEEIVQAVAVSSPDVGLAIIGGGTKRGGYRTEDTERHIAVLGVQERVQILPFVPRRGLLELVQHADVGMLLYRDVNLNYYFCAPNKLYEYAACGLPMIGPAWLGTAELFRRYGLGLTVLPHDVEQIAGAIEAMRDPELRARYGSSAARAFREELCLERYWDREGPSVRKWLQA